jgi:rhodanese-related sulfurtransferase
VSFFAEHWILILIAFTSGGMLVWPLVQRSAGGSTAVGTAEAVRLINRERGLLIDVAEPGEFAQAHARGARNVPLGQLEGSRELPSNKALPVILMCPSGMRAGRAATLLRKAGYERAVSVSGGTRAWAEASLPVARGEEGAKDAREPKGGKAERGDKGADKGGDKGAGRSPRA